MWAAGALHQTPLGLTGFPDPLARLRALFVKGRGGKRKERSGEGEERGVKGEVVRPAFFGESYAHAFVVLGAFTDVTFQFC